MGEIYEAEQLDLKRSVALKVIRLDKTDDMTCARFHREREVLARLHQTHIVPVFAAGEEDGLQYFAMQYIDGESLGHVLHALRRPETLRASTTKLSLADLVKALSQSKVQAPSDQPASSVSHQPGQPDPGSSRCTGKAAVNAGLFQLGSRGIGQRGRCGRDGPRPRHFSPRSEAVEPHG